MIKEDKQTTQPSTKGKWIHVNTYDTSAKLIANIEEAQCSVCKMYSTQLQLSGVMTYKFCPRCGAEMLG